MKKIFTLVITLTASMALNAQTQIGNPGFENWESVSGGSEPVNWNSFLTASGSLTSFSANQIDESSDARPGSSGSKSVRVWSRHISLVNVVANGNITLGRINMGSSTASSSSNYNKSIISDANFSEVMTERPDSIVFWVKFTPNGHNGNARMKATIHDNYEYRDPEDAAAMPHVLGIAELNYPSTGGQWVRKSVPFNYTGPATSANFILLTFTTNENPGGGAGNDQVWIDDVELVYVPKPSYTVSTASVCEGGTVSFTNTSEHYPTSYSWSFAGGTPATSTAANPTVTYNTPGTYDVVLTATNQWGSKTVTMTSQITVSQNDDASFSYAQPNYCSNVTNPVPTASNPGTFTSTPSGLVFANASTGEINLESSAAGTYTITHTGQGTCPGTATGTVTIFEGADASFSYPTNTICVLGGNPVPTVTETPGTFSAEPSGIVFVSAATGEIDVDASTQGTYDISYVRGGGCPDTVIISITLTDVPDAEFSYSSSAYCVNATDPSPVFVPGANAGSFSSTAGLVINANTGVIDVSASAPGSYTVTNDIAAVGSCPAATHATNVQINDLPAVALTLTQDTVCTGTPSFLLAGGTPAGGTYSGTGVLSGIFNPSALSQGESSVITYTYTDQSTACSNSATDVITVDGCLSVESFEMDSPITVYPNPTTGMLTLTNVKETTQYTIISVSGQVIGKGEVSANSNAVDMTDVQNGVYLLQVQQGQNVHTVRIVKQ